MHEFIFDEHAIQERCAEMSEWQLVMWSFILERVRGIDERLRGLEQSFLPGKRASDAELCKAQDALKAEIAKRTIAKGGQTA